MKLKSRQIVPLIGLLVTGYLSSTGSIPPGSPSNFAAKVKDLPVIQAYQPPDLSQPVRPPFLTLNEWTALCTQNTTATAVARIAPVERPSAVPARSLPRPRVAAPAPDPVISGILLGFTKKTAIIDGEIFTEGDQRRGLVVTRIEPGKIHLKRAGKPLILTLAQPLAGRGISVRRVGRVREGQTRSTHQSQVLPASPSPAAALPPTPPTPSSPRPSP